MPRVSSTQPVPRVLDLVIRLPAWHPCWDVSKAMSSMCLWSPLPNPPHLPPKLNLYPVPCPNRLHHSPPVTGDRSLKSDPWSLALSNSIGLPWLCLFLLLTFSCFSNVNCHHVCLELRQHSPNPSLFFLSNVTPFTPLNLLKTRIYSLYQESFRGGPPVALRIMSLILTWLSKALNDPPLEHPRDPKQEYKQRYLGLHLLPSLSRSHSEGTGHAGVNTPAHTSKLCPPPWSLLGLRVYTPGLHLLLEGDV